MYNLHLSTRVFDSIAERHDNWEGDINEIDIEVKHSSWVNMDGTPKHKTLIDKRKKLKARLDRLNGLTN